MSSPQEIAIESASVLIIRTVNDLLDLIPSDSSDFSPEFIASIRESLPHLIATHGPDLGYALALQPLKDAVRVAADHHAASAASSDPAVSSNSAASDASFNPAASSNSAAGATDANADANAAADAADAADAFAAKIENFKANATSRIAELTMLVNAANAADTADTADAADTDDDASTS